MIVGRSGTERPRGRPDASADLVVEVSGLPIESQWNEHNIAQPIAARVTILAGRTVVDIVERNGEDSSPRHIAQLIVGIPRDAGDVRIECFVDRRNGLAVPILQDAYQKQEDEVEEAYPLGRGISSSDSDVAAGIMPDDRSGSSSLGMGIGAVEQAEA